MNTTRYRNIQDARAAQRFAEERLRPEATHHVDSHCLECGCVETSAEVFDGEFTGPCPSCGSLIRARA